jgi:hypothetical protein
VGTVASRALSPWHEPRRKREAVKVTNVKIEHRADTSPDFSFMGEYTDELKPGVIVRTYNEFFEKLPDESAMPERGREFRAFKPYAGGEKVGTPEYYKYGKRDYDRMESYNNQDWAFIGIVATATVRFSTSEDDSGISRITHFRSGGLWGIESDIDNSYLEEVAKEQLLDLRAVLDAFGIHVTDEEWSGLTIDLEPVLA